MGYNEWEVIYVNWVEQMYAKYGEKMNDNEDKEFEDIYQSEYQRLIMRVEKKENEEKRELEENDRIYG